MSVAKFLLKSFGIKGIKYKGFYPEKSCLFFEGTLLKNHHICPKCKSKNIHLKGSKIRKFRMIPWSSLKCFLILKVHKLFCLDCKRRSWPNLPFTNGKQRMVKSYVSYILDLIRLSSILSIAKFLNVSWDLIKDVHKNYLQSKYKKVPYKQLRYLSIDEFSIKKGHKYMTIFVDIESGRIIYAVEGRKEENLRAFLQKLAIKAINLKAIAMDMSVPYFSAISKILPKVDIVFDHFHVSAVINKALDEIRKSEQKYNRSIVKGNRFLLLRNYSDLDITQRTRLDALLKINAPLFKAHALKEQFRMFWVQPNIQEASRFFLIWYWEVHLTMIKPLIKAANTLLRYGKGLINYFKHRISNGKIEGINNKIKTMKRQAYGFRDMKYFTLRLYNLHNQGYQLAG